MLLARTGSSFSSQPHEHSIVVVGGAPFVVAVHAIPAFAAFCGRVGPTLRFGNLPDAGNTAQALPPS